MVNRATSQCAEFEYNIFLRMRPPLYVVINARIVLLRDFFFSSLFSFFSTRGPCLLSLRSSRRATKKKKDYRTDANCVVRQGANIWERVSASRRTSVRFPFSLSNFRFAGERRFWQVSLEACSKSWTRQNEERKKKKKKGKNGEEIKCTIPFSLEKQTSFSVNLLENAGYLLTVEWPSKIDMPE